MGNNSNGNGNGNGHHPVSGTAVAERSTKGGATTPRKGVRFVEPEPVKPERDEQAIMHESLLCSELGDVFRVENLTRGALIELVIGLYNQMEGWCGAYGALDEHYKAELYRLGIDADDLPQFDRAAYMDKADFKVPLPKHDKKGPRKLKKYEALYEPVTPTSKLPKWARDLEAEILEFDQQCGITDDLLTLDHLSPEGLRLFWAKHFQEEAEHKHRAQDEVDLLRDMLEAHGIQSPQGSNRYRNSAGSLYPAPGGVR